ncbi:4719_t:CDS:1, partial [Racocetra fulgida]
ERVFKLERRVDELDAHGRRVDELNARGRRVHELDARERVDELVANKKLRTDNFEVV